MQKRSVQRVSREVYKQFPELKGAQPTVRPQNGVARAANGNGRKQAKSRGDSESERYLLTFNGRAELPNGRSIVRVVRVVSDGRGNVLKITTSR